MQQITAIGFDLFDTLITVRHLDVNDALGRLVGCLQQEGFAIEAETFLPVYRDCVRDVTTRARAAGRETHNRFWISAALTRLGDEVSPHDARIERAIEAYFSAFLDHATLLPDTLEMLQQLQPHYRLGLLSNFTHGPAVRAILAHLGLTPYLDVTLISGELGFRKPHPRVFRELERQFDRPADQIAFIGDDLDADVRGARRAGFQPVWTTYARAYRGDASPPSRSEPALDPDVPTVTSWVDLLRLFAVR